MKATTKPIRGGWAATLKSAAQQGLPVRMDDPRYWSPWVYVDSARIVDAMRNPYHEAVHARAAQAA